MSIIIKPKSAKESFSWFLTLPFYKWKDMVNRNPVEFKPEEIISVQRRSDMAGGGYVVSYSRADFFGFVYSANTPEGSFVTVSETPFNKAKFSKDLLGRIKNHVLHFYKFSPTVTVLVILMVFVTFLSSIREFFLSNVFSVNKYVHAACDTECAQKIADTFFTLFVVGVVATVPLVIGLLFYFMVSKKHKDANTYTAIRTESFLIMIVAVWFTVGVLQMAVRNDVLRKISNIQSKSQ